MNLSVVWRGNIFWTVYLRTSDGVWTNARVPGVAGVAIGATTDVMEPTPVRVENDGTLDSRAASARGALRDAELGVGLGGERAHLLTVGDREERERY